MIILLVVLAVSLLLRLQRFDFPLDYVFAWGDGTRDYLLADHILTFGEIPFLGPYNLLQDAETGIRNSPIYFYMLALFLVPFNHILTLSAVSIFLQTLVVILVYFIAKRLFNVPTALMAVLLFSFNPEVIAQSDFVWQPYLMHVVALLALYLLLKSQARNYKLLFVSLGLFSLAFAIHNSAFSWIPVFFALAFYFLKRIQAPLRLYLGAFFCFFFTLFLLYLPVLLFYLKNGFSLSFNLGSQTFVHTINQYLINFHANISKFFSTFYIENVYLGLFLLGLFLLVFFRVNVIEKKKLLFIFILFISPFVFASFFTKIRLHYLILSFSMFTMLVAAIINSLSINLRIILLILFFSLFSGFLLPFKYYHPPFVSKKMVDEITVQVIGELTEVKRTLGAKSFDFFQVFSIAQGDKTLEYPVLDTVLLVALEEKLKTKLTKVSDLIPYNHIQINKQDYIIVACWKLKKADSNCGDLFKSLNPGYAILRTTFENNQVTIYLSKKV